MILRNLIIPAIIAGAAHAGLFLIPPGKTPPPPPPTTIDLSGPTYPTIKQDPVQPDPEKEKTDLDKVLESIKPHPTVFEAPRVDMPDDVDRITMVPQPNVDPNAIERGVMTIPQGDTIGDGLKDSSGQKARLTFGQLDNKPRTIFQAEPQYPYTQKMIGTSGEVLVQFVVDERGYVTDVHVVRSSHRDFEEPTVRAVSKWRFEPGMKNGRRVSFRMSVPISFTLNEAE